MKRLLLFLVLLTGLSAQALSMGHPHNLFTARKQLRSKKTAVSVRPQTCPKAGWREFAPVDRDELSRKLVSALSRVAPF